MVTLAKVGFIVTSLAIPILGWSAFVAPGMLECANESCSIISAMVLIEMSLYWASSTMCVDC